MVDGKPPSNQNDDLKSGSSSSKEALEKDAVLCMRFSQDGNSLVITTANGFRVFDVTSNGELVMVFDVNTIPQVVQIQRLFNSNLVAFVSALDLHLLRVFNMKRNDVICDHRYKEKIRWLSMNRIRVVVATEKKVIID